MHVSLWLLSIWILLAFRTGTGWPLPASAAYTSGAGIYHEYCVTCHGLDATGNGPNAPTFASPPPNLRSLAVGRPTAQLVTQVRDGGASLLPFDAGRLRSLSVEVEALSAHLRRLPAINWTQVAEGQRLYAERCALCHGVYGHPGAAPSTAGGHALDFGSAAFQSRISDADLLNLFRHGTAQMPALLPDAGDATAHALVAYLRALSPGFELYSRYCVNCHGLDGRGTDTARGAHRPQVVFDAAFFARTTAGRLRTAVWHMVNDERPAMPHYRAALGQGQVTDLLTYLRQLEMPTLTPHAR